MKTQSPVSFLKKFESHHRFCWVNATSWPCGRVVHCPCARLGASSPLELVLNWLSLGCKLRVQGWCCEEHALHACSLDDTQCQIYSQKTVSQSRRDSHNLYLRELRHVFELTFTACDQVIATHSRVQLLLPVMEVLCSLAHAVLRTWTLEQARTCIVCRPWRLLLLQRSVNISHAFSKTSDRRSLDNKLFLVSCWPWCLWLCWLAWSGIQFFDRFAHWVCRVLL